MAFDDFEIDSRTRIGKAALLFGVDSDEFLSVYKGESKYCNSCSTLRPVADFHADKTMSDGRYGICKYCKQAYMKQDTKKFKPKRLYRQYKNNAKYRGYEFRLEIEDFEALRDLSCYYCGTRKGYMGYDRITNEKGYTKDNIVPCCSVCNYMKCDMTVNEWFNHMIQILKYNKEYK
jgi:hypothetical protein